MTAFPSLTPSSRTFTPGVRPTTAITTLSGGEERTQNSNCIVGQSLRLAFEGLEKADAILIVNHYLEKKTRYKSFAIPNALLSGLTDPAAITPSGYAWIYASRPEVTDAALFRDVTVDLEMVRI